MGEGPIVPPHPLSRTWLGRKPSPINWVLSLQVCFPLPSGLTGKCWPYNSFLQKQPVTTSFPGGTIFGLLKGTRILALTSATWEYTWCPESQQATPRHALQSFSKMGGRRLLSKPCFPRPHVNRQEAPGASLCYSCDTVTNL